MYLMFLEHALGIDKFLLECDPFSGQVTQHHLYLESIPDKNRVKSPSPGKHTGQKQV